MATEYVLDADKIAHWRIDNHVPLKQLARAAGGEPQQPEPCHQQRQGSEDEPAAQSGGGDGRRPARHREEEGGEMRFEIIERHIIDVPDSELTDGERPLGKMALVEVLDVIAENPRRFIERYEMYREEVIRLGGKL